MAASERLGRVQVITPHVLQFLIRMPLVMWKGERQGMSDGARRHCMSGLCFLGRSADAWTAERTIVMCCIGTWGYVWGI